MKPEDVFEFSEEGWVQDGGVRGSGGVGKSKIQLIKSSLALKYLTVD